MSRADEPQVWIEGARPVREALRAGRRPIFEIWLPRETRSEAQRELVELASRFSIPTRRVERTDQVRARAAPLPELGFEELLIATPSPRLLVALDGITDVGNFGSIARSAETAGVHGIVLELRRSPPLSTAALRASSGALEHLPLARAPHLGRALELAAGEGCRILVADSRGDPLVGLSPEELVQDVVWVLGSEDLGVRPAIRRRAHRIVGIPTRGRIESLGVAAAGALLLHHTAWVRASQEAERAPSGETTFR